MNKPRWVETTDGKIIEVRAETESFVYGAEVLIDSLPLRYAENDVYEKEKIIDEGDEE